MCICRSKFLSLTYKLRPTPVILLRATSNLFSLGFKFILVEAVIWRPSIFLEKNSLVWVWHNTIHIFCRKRVDWLHSQFYTSIYQTFYCNHYRVLYSHFDRCQYATISLHILLTILFSNVCIYTWESVTWEGLFLLLEINFSSVVGSVFELSFLIALSNHEVGVKFT